MVIWGHFPAEMDKINIPVSLGHITKYLVIGPVFLNDLDDMLEMGFLRCYYLRDRHKFVKFIVCAGGCYLLYK